MFGFVTFVYPKKMKMILAKGNPHFVCNSRVIVKPYKEKGKILDKYYKTYFQPSLGVCKKMLSCALNLADLTTC